MGRNYPLGFGVDSNGMLSREIDDHIISKIYSMLGTCTNEELLKYQLAIAQKSVLLQNEIADLRGKLEVEVSKHKNEVKELQFQLEMQTIKYKKAKDEASLNARALKRCIANHQRLREELQRDLPAESSVDQGDERMQEFREEAQTVTSTELSPNKKCQMQEFSEEIQMSTPTELSRKQRCQPMDELRPIKYPKYQLSHDTNKLSGNHMRNIYVDGDRTMKLVNVTSEGHEDDERRYKWVDGRQFTKKRLLQELDPNIDDLDYRLSMPEDADEV